MNKLQKRVLTLLAFITFAASTLVYYTPAVLAASVSSHVRIVGTSRTIWFGDVVTDGCTVTDKEGKKHTFTQPVALCALDAASKTGNFAYVAKDFGGSLGLFLEGIAEDVSASDFSTYWLYDVNGQPAQVGVSSYVVNSGDSLFFHFENPNADVNKRAVNDGITYLRSQQETSGQISGFSGVNGWAAMTFAAADISPATVTKGGSSLLDYISANPPTTSSGATEWERGILAITASDKNPYNFGNVNYVQNLESYHNNFQIGVTTQVNDDIFGLLALVAAGSGASSTVKQDALNFILTQQNDDGGFSWSTTGNSDVDDTAAALQALVAAQKAGLTATGLADSISKAKTYLLSAQNSDGGFPYAKGDTSNASSTAWAGMALSALGVTGTENSTVKTAFDAVKAFIRGNQEENGSFKWQPSSTGETFTTSYAVFALTGKHWPVKVFVGTAPTPTPSASPAPSPKTTVTPSPGVTISPSPTPAPKIIKGSLKQRFQELQKRRVERFQAVRERQKRMFQRMLDRIQLQLDSLTRRINILVWSK